MLNDARYGWLYDVVLVAVLFRIEVNVPATNTRLPMYSMSVISPVVIRGTLVRGDVRGRAWCARASAVPPATTVVTVIDSEAWLLALALFAASTASTV